MWVPIVAPVIGGLIGGFAYQRLILPFLPRVAAGAVTADQSTGEVRDIVPAEVPPYVPVSPR